MAGARTTELEEWDMKRSALAKKKKREKVLKMVGI